MVLQLQKKGAMSSPSGLPMAPFQPFSRDPGEVGRPDPETKIEGKGKKSNLTSSLHCESFLQSLFL